MSIQYYLEIESHMSLNDLVKIMKETHVTIKGETFAIVDTPQISFQIDIGAREKRAFELGIKPDAVLIFWSGGYDAGFAKAIQILQETHMNLAYYYQDMDDPMFYRVTTQAGMKGRPSKASYKAERTRWPCLRAVEI